MTTQYDLSGYNKILRYKYTMEELSNVRRKTQNAKRLLADKRAMEMLMQHPQTLEPLPSMARNPYGTPSGMKMKGGAKNIDISMEVIPTPKKIKGSAMRQTEKDMEDERLAMEIKGLKNKTKKLRGGFGPTSFQPQGLQITTAPGTAITPGGIASNTTGVPDQPPASFRRNQVGMGKKMLGQDMKGTYRGGAMCGSGMCGCGMCETGCDDCVGGTNGRMVGGARAMRGAAIAKLMKEKGVTLGQASKMLKEMSK
jgi:hypothetical protein